MDGSIVLHHDEKETGGSSEDILIRRLKNRERQRRYRARKRQEADLRKASNVDQSTPIHYQQMHSKFLSLPLEVEILVNGSTPDYLTRTHCQRDWKKDARTAHLHKKQETWSFDNAGSVVSTGTSATFVDDGHQEILQSNISNTLVLDNNATNILQSSRRHWKAEARNKRSSE